MLGLAQALTSDMPATLAALAAGATSEYRAQLVAQEFGCLSADDRKVADREIGPQLAGLGDLRSRHAAAGIAARLDPEAVLAKIRGAVADRRVSIRPAPDTMLRLSALLPLAGGMAAFFALCRHAEHGVATGDVDGRTRDQVMADELVARLSNPPAGAANGIDTPTNPPAGAANGIDTPTNPPAGAANGIDTPTNPPAGAANGIDTPTNPPAGAANGIDTPTNPPAGAANGIDTPTNPPAGAANGIDTPTNPPAGAANGIDTPTNPPAGAANGIDTPTNPPAGAANGMTPTDAPASAVDPAGHSPSTAAADGSGSAARSSAAPGDADITESAPADHAPGSAVPTGCDDGAPHAGGAIDLQLVMTDRALLDGNDAPAHVTGYGPIPAALARHLIATSTDRSDRPDASAAKAFLRRLFTDPDTGQLVAMDSKAREFPAGARRFLIARDQICRTPWCDAPIRHIDHIDPAARGGPTTIGNGQGLCANCNYSKQSPGWAARMDGDHTIVTTTPTAHTACSPPPDLPRSQHYRAPEGRQAPSTTVA